MRRVLIRHEAPNRTVPLQSVTNDAETFNDCVAADDRLRRSIEGKTMFDEDKCFITETMSSFSVFLLITICHVNFLWMESADAGGMSLFLQWKLCHHPI